MLTLQEVYDHEGERVRGQRPLPRVVDVVRLRPQLRHRYQRSHAPVHCLQINIFTYARL